VNIVGADLESESAALAGFLKMIPLADVPLCFRERLCFRTSDAGATFTIIAVHCGEWIKLDITVLGAMSQGETLEIWQNGELAHAFPADKGISPRIRTGATAAIRLASSNSGTGLRFAAIEFETVEWLAAALADLYAGDWTGAAALIRREILPKHPAVGTSWRKLAAYLEALKGWVTVDGGVLMPLAVRRAGGLAADIQPTVFRTVWYGIVACWPEAEGMATLWNPSPDPLLDATSLPKDILNLIEAAEAAAKRETLSPPSPVPPSDANLKMGWAAIQGWEALLKPDYPRALHFFGSMARPPEDPFCLAYSEHLARHLMNSENMDAGDEARSSSNAAVWDAFFSGLSEPGQGTSR
jgi:hypothetical protein